MACILIVDDRPANLLALEQNRRAHVRPGYFPSDEE